MNEAQLNHCAEINERRRKETVGNSEASREISKWRREFIAEQQRNISDRLEAERSGYVRTKRVQVVDGYEIELPYTGAQEEFDRKTVRDQHKFEIDALHLTIDELQAAYDKLRDSKADEISAQVHVASARLMNCLHRRAVPTVDALEHKVARMVRALHACGMSLEDIAKL